MEIPPWPSELGSRSSNATTFGCRSGNSSSPSSSARSTVISRSCGGISLASARSSVVFPALVDPAIMMFLRAATAAARKRGQLRVERAVADQVGQEDLAQPGAADRDRRAARDLHHRGEPGAVRQPQVELRVGGVERPAGQPGVRREGLDELDQLVVGLGDRLEQSSRPSA